VSADIILVGAFHEIVELCELSPVRIVGIIDNRVEGEFMGHEILGTDDDASRLLSSFRNVPVLIVPDDPSTRKKLAELYIRTGYQVASLVSPHALICRTARLGTGTVVQSGCNVSSFVVIGDFVKVNSHANVMHESIVGDYSTIAPNVVILGRASIQRECYIGANATILPGIEIGAGAIVGAGAVVTRNVPARTVVAGNPARVMRRL